MVDTILLIKSMLKRNDSFKDLANALQISENDLYIKIIENNFTLPEMNILKERFSLSGDEAISLFFEGWRHGK